MSLAPNATDPLPASDPDVDLRYAYDASDMRVLKTAVGSKEELYTAYVFDSLELRRTAWRENSVDPEQSDYEDEKFSEIPYLSANGVRLARLSYGDDGVPGADLHVFLELADHLGSNGIVIDKATGELVERTTYQAYGTTESDYRPARWNSFREDYRFTDKEEDIEVGLSYFGARYYAAALGRWISPDPLAVHELDADLNLYAYVRGSVLRMVDPLGLNGEDAVTGTGGATAATGLQCSGCTMPSLAPLAPVAEAPLNANGGPGGAPALDTAAAGAGGSTNNVIWTPQNQADAERTAVAIPRMGVHAGVETIRHGPAAGVEDFFGPQVERTIHGQEQFVDPYGGDPLLVGIAKQLGGGSQHSQDGGMNASGTGGKVNAGSSGITVAPLAKIIYDVVTANGQKASQDGTPVGPSGKSKFHYSNSPTKKHAVEGAKHQGGSQVIKDKAKGPQPDHWHGVKQDGERVSGPNKTHFNVRGSRPGHDKPEIP